MSNHISSPMPTKLYDRDDQLLLLRNAYERCCFQQAASQREVIVITGPQGAGKTALSYQLKDRVEENGGYFCTGKFSQLAFHYRALNNSYQPFITALTELCQQVETAGEDQVKLLRSILQQTFTDDEIRVFERGIPAVGAHILGERRRPPAAAGPAAATALAVRRSGATLLATPEYTDESRLANLICLFVNAIAQQILLVFHLDDLQWADNTAMDLLTSLARTDIKSDGFTLMFLGTCRVDDEDALHMNLPTSLRPLSNRGVAVTTIPVRTVSESSVREIITDHFIPPIEELELVARLVHSKANGNVFFVLQLLKWYQDDHILTRKNDLESWQWDRDDMLHTIESQSLSQLMTSRVAKLTDTVKNVLKAAACLGAVFEERVLWAAGTVDKSTVAEALQVAEEKGLILLDQELGTGCFLHDKIQQVVYALIPAAERASNYLDLGRRLFPCSPPSVMDEHLILVADLIGTTSHIVDDPEEKVDFAKLFLRAGQRAALHGAVSSAAAYLRTGINLLSADTWTSQYKLTLSLYNKAVELEYYNGNLDRVDALAQEVLANATSLDATLKVQFTRIYSLGTRGETQTAVDEGLAVLKSLGESFPSRITSLHVQSALTKCRRMMQRTSYTDIAKLPLMTDATKLTSLRLMLLVACYAVHVRRKLVPLIAVRAINHIMTFGQNDMSCAAFATLSWMFACRGHFDEAAGAGKLALQILNLTNKDQEWRARVSGFVYGGYYCLRHSYRDCLTPLLDAYRSTIVLGDIQFSVGCAMLYSGIGFYSGVSISKLLGETLGFRDLCVRNNLKTSNALACVILQGLDQMTGKEIDSILYCWPDQARSEEEGLLLDDNICTVPPPPPKKFETEFPFAYLQSLYYQHFVAVYLDDLVEAQHLSALLQNGRHKTEAIPFLVPTFLFLDGLVAAKSAGSSRSALKRATTCLVQLRRYAQACPQNFTNKVCLLEAELLSNSPSPMTTGRSTATTTTTLQAAACWDKYKTSMDLAAQQGLIHEQALALEYAAYALLRNHTGRLEEAREYMEKAKSLYLQWGAHAKVHLLEDVVI